MSTKSFKLLLKSVFLSGAVGFLFVGCAGSGPTGSYNSAPAPAPNLLGAGLRGQAEVSVDSGASYAPLVSKRQVKRPGLGTGWGDEKASFINYTNFERGSLRGVSSIYYNDEEGVEAMKGSWSRKGDGMQKAVGGIVEWGVKSGWGYTKNVMGNGKRFVVGKKGREYSIQVRNICKARIEVVLSVDGLDVTDGKTASVKKRGYIIKPGESLTVSGFRTSEEAVAAFKFSTVSGSYANQRHGSTRNVGVIGMGVYVEKGRNPWTWGASELQQRGGARAFAEAPATRAR